MTETELEDLIAKLFHDVFVVEVTIGRRRGSVHVYLVLEKREGITVDDLSSVQEILRPRLEMEFGRERLALEVSSPGLKRKIKHSREYGIFTGRNIQVLTGEEWIKGTLKAANLESITLETGHGLLDISIKEIRKGRLDS